jgi:hypothetical protein
MEKREVRSIRIAQLQPSVCCGVYGVWRVGDSLWRAGGIMDMPYHYISQVVVKVSYCVWYWDAEPVVVVVIVIICD